MLCIGQLQRWDQRLCIRDFTFTKQYQRILELALSTCTTSTDSVTTKNNYSLHTASQPRITIHYKQLRYYWFVRSFVRSLGAGVQPTLDPALRPFWIGPVCQPRERRGVDRCVWCECCVGWRRESRLELLVYVTFTKESNAIVNCHSLQTGSQPRITIHYCCQSYFQLMMDSHSFSVATKLHCLSRQHHASLSAAESYQLVYITSLTSLIIHRFPTLSLLAV